MSMPDHQLELLSPARSADIGIEAINHGADAVYIGGPSFGARTSADNSVQDIARLSSCTPAPRPTSAPLRKRVSCRMPVCPRSCWHAN